MPACGSGGCSQLQIFCQQLIISLSTLSGHWQQEINQYAEFDAWVRPVEDSKEPGLDKKRSVSLERASQMVPIQNPNFTEEELLDQGELWRRF
jgi:hypothetical protein